MLRLIRWLFWGMCSMKFPTVVLAMCRWAVQPSELIVTNTTSVGRLDWQLFFVCVCGKHVCLSFLMHSSHLLPPLRLMILLTTLAPQSWKIALKRRVPEHTEFDWSKPSCPLTMSNLFSALLSGNQVSVISSQEWLYLWKYISCSNRICLKIE